MHESLFYSSSFDWSIYLLEELKRDDFSKKVSLRGKSYVVLQQTSTMNSLKPEFATAEHVVLFEKVTPGEHHHHYTVLFLIHRQRRDVTRGCCRHWVVYWALGRFTAETAEWAGLLCFLQQETSPQSWLQPTSSWSCHESKGLDLVVTKFALSVTWVAPCQLRDSCLLNVDLKS